MIASSRGGDHPLWEPILADLVEELTARLQAGQPVDLAGCVRDYPEYAYQLRELLPALEALAGANGNQGPPTQAHSPSARADFSGLRPAANSDRHAGPGLGKVGDYRLLREVGRGG